MYSKTFRQNIQAALIQFAEQDQRIVAAAIVGSESIGTNDEWSDIDLTFGVDETSDFDVVLSDWTDFLQTQFEAKILFDLEFKGSLYRVFLLPNCLQIDLSFTPASGFGATTDKFKLLFGEAHDRSRKELPALQTVYGYAVLYALKVRTSIERQKYWQAMYYLQTFRDYVLQLICLKYSLSPFDGRGYDEIPEGIKEQLSATFCLEPSREMLRPALQKVTTVLNNEAVGQIELDCIHELNRIASL